MTTPNNQHTSARARCVSSFALALLLSLFPVIDLKAQGADITQRPAGGAAREGRRDAQGRPTTKRDNSSARPRLVLLISVDQFRYDYLERFGDLFVENGLRRLLRDGASWTQTNFDHIPTETAPGHATMMTGTWPAETGIIGNTWYDRDRGRSVTNVSDESSNLIGGGAQEASSSPRKLLVSTVGDELKLATSGRSKVVGVSIKDRAAILPAGRLANGAYWFSSQTGRFVSSTYYFNQLPAWVARFNDSRPADKYFGRRWERVLCEESRANCADEYERRAGADNAEWENQGSNKDTKTFPHVITGGAAQAGPEFYDAINYSPYSNDLLLSFAEQAIINESLGADSETDVLTVSFSANDIVGHRFGPYSQEAMDMTLRVDRQIAALLDLVDKRVGLRNTLVAFTADHGVAPAPEHAASLNLPGGRIKASELMTAVKNAIKARYGKPDTSAPDNTADYVLAFNNYSVYFNPVALRRDGVNQEEIERVVGDAALTVPGIARYFTRTQLLRGAVSPADPVARRALHGFHPRRSGDVLIIQEPFKYIIEGTLTATHGTPYSYDTHVPLVIMGAGVTAGRYAQSATPADIAPTLSALLRVQPPSNSTGRVLVEALK